MSSETPMEEVKGSSATAAATTETKTPAKTRSSYSVSPIQTTLGGGGGNKPSIIGYRQVTVLDAKKVALLDQAPLEVSSEPFRDASELRSLQSPDFNPIDDAPHHSG